MEVTFKLDGPRIKRPQHLKDNVFVICSAKTLVIEPADSTKIEAGIVLHLPKEAKAFIASKFRSQDIYEVNKQKSRLWIEILNSSYFEKLKRKIKTPLGFFVIEPEKLKSKYETKKKPKKQTGLPNNWYKTWKMYWQKIRSQTGGFLNWYDFAYAGRDTVNQVTKIAPEIIKQATGQIDRIAQDGINQVIKSGGAEVVRILPKLIRGATEDVYKTPFRLLGNLGKQQFQKFKRKILRR